MERDNRGLWWKISAVGSFMSVHDCNGDKTADSSGGCDFIESIVAPQYHLHLDIIYCNFKEKWLRKLFLRREDSLSNQIVSKHFSSYVSFMPWTICWRNLVSFASPWFSPPLPSLIN